MVQDRGADEQDEAEDPVARPFKRWRAGRELGCAAIAGIGWLILWWPAAIGGGHLFVRDLLRFAVPSRRFLIDELAAGRLPLWTPWLGGGQPWLADPAHQFFYPGTWLSIAPVLVGADAYDAVDLFVLGHSALALLGMRVLLATLAVAPVPGWSLALVYCASGVLVSLADNVTYLPAAAWLPLALATCQGMWRRTSSLRNFAGLALCASMLLLCGDVLDLGLLGLLVVVLLVGGVRARRSAGHLGLGLLVAALLVVLLGAAQWSPTLELLADGTRGGGLSLADAQVWSLPPARLLELVVPFAFGAKYPLREFLVPALYPHTGTPWFESLHLGLPVVLLAALSLLGRGRRWAPWLVALVAVLLLALGRHTPLHALAHEWLPLFDTQRYPEKLALWLTVLLVVLAGLGTRQARALARRLRAAAPRRDVLARTAVSIALPMILLVLIAEWPARAFLGEQAIQPSAYWHSRLGQPIGWLQGALMHALAVSLLLVACVWLARQHPRHAIAVLLLGAAVDALWLHAGHLPVMPSSLLERPAEMAQMAVLREAARVHVDRHPPDYRHAPHGEVDTRIDTLLGAGVPALLAGSQWLRSSLLDRRRLASDSNVLGGVPLLDSGLAPLAPHAQVERLHAAEDGDLGTLREAAVSHVLSPAAREAFWRERGLLRIGADPESDTVLLRVPGAQPLVSRADGGEVRLDARQPGRIRVHVAGVQPAQLTLRESAAAGWQAWVDGHEVEAAANDTGMLVVALPAGEHTVELRYRQPGLTTGLLLSIAGLAGLWWLLRGMPLPGRGRRGLSLHGA